jgi:hypothetical protein
VLAQDDEFVPLFCVPNHFLPNVLIVNASRIASLDILHIT